MTTKLMPLFFVAVLLISSCSAIAAVQTKIVDGATVSSAQTAPQFAPLNPDFVKYQQGLSTSNAVTGAHAVTGFIPPPINLTQLKGQSVRSALVSSASLPPSYDLRPNYVTTVKNQGSCGSCWAFATYASLESYLLKNSGGTRDFSEDNMNNANGFDIAPCAGGNDFMATAYLARWSGPVNEGSNLPVQQHVQDVYFIADRDNANIKTAIMTYGAVYTQMYISSSSFYNPSTHAYYDPYTTKVDHATAIVGWNDNYPASNFNARPSGNGAWIVKNSYGKDWGDNGYFYVSYYDANIGQDNAAFTAQPTTNYNNIYQYDPLGATRQFGEGSTSEWGANIFTAKSSENLAAVSFYTLSPNAPYEIYVYTDPTSGPINPSGSVAHTTGSTALAGYHTVALGSSVSLQAGQRFSIVVKFTSADGYPVPTEAPLSDYSSQARANAGESYYHADDAATWSTSSTWHDITSGSPNTNICIKAFTMTNPLVDGNVASAPAASSQDAKSLDLFAQGPDGALWWTHWDGQKWSWSTSLSGRLTSAPAAISRPNGKIDVFVRGTDGALWTRSTTNGGTSWSDWSKIAAQLLAGTGPAAYAWGDARIGVFVTGTNKALYHMWTDSAGTHSWENLGGILTSSPAATSSGNGVIDVYGRGGDGALWSREYKNNAWSSWSSLSGQLTSGTGPAACSWGPGRLDVFVQGMDGALWHRGYTGGTWYGWQPLGGKLTSSPAAVSRSAGKIDVFVRGGDNKLWERSYDNGWGQWTSVGGA